MAIAIHGRTGEVDTGTLESWLGAVLEELAPGASELAVRLVDDDEMSELNERYRQIAAPTDVLSFPGEETIEGRDLGDVVISVETARRQADAAGWGLERELMELLLHGVLHCLGWDHEADDGEMARLELDLRQRFVAAAAGADRA